MSSTIANIESAVVNDLKAVGSFFSGAFAKLQAANAGSAAASTVQNAANQATSAASVIEAALPALAEEGVKLALSLIPGGAGYVAIADEFIDLVIAGLQAKKSGS